MKRFTILLILTVLLSGCARKTPTETIVDNHIEHYNQVLDYANNEMEDTPDTRFLKNELKNCVMTLDDVKQTYYSEIATCKAKTDYWRLATFGLIIALCGAILFILRKAIL